MARMETTGNDAVSTVPQGARERVLDAAWARMNRDGYRAVTMSELARQLGMSKKTLYVHFADKEDLVRALVRRTSDRIGREVERAVARAGGDAELELAGAFEAVSRVLSELRPVLVEDIHRHLPQVWREMEADRRRRILYLEGLVRKGQQAGTFHDVDPRVAVLSFLAAVETLGQGDVLRAEGLSIQDVFRGVSSIFLRGLLKRPPAPKPDAP